MSNKKQPRPKIVNHILSFPVLSFDRLPVLEGVTTGAHVVAVVVVVTAHLGAVQDSVVG